MTDRIRKRPYSRQWSRLISTKEGSGSLVATSGIDIAFTGSNYFVPSGRDYRFDRLDLYFSTSESKRVTLSISNSQHPYIYHASENNCVRLSLQDETTNWIIEKNDPLRLEVDIATTGYCWYKLYVEEV